ncbi:MAG: hypothetical protein CVU11_09910 [Bacteroidetes bacterium HGW-Bacteroidetes-6]|jgi:hypothetical protein|nr:MAG: hypothetical protein CVU11_09910 [Bacteroidetes bacterium HGW-Bacteroidetes-6]
MKAFFILIFAVFIATAPVVAQNCTPDAGVVSLGVSGMFPDPNVSPNLPDGTIGVAYTTTITFVVPADSLVDLSSILGFPFPPVTLTVNYFEAVAPVLLPAGLAAVCEPSSCQTTGGSNGCMAIEGTPTASGTTPISVTGFFSLNVPVSVPVIGGTTQILPATFAPYSLTINTGSVSIDENSSPIASVFPNPFCSELSVGFVSAKNQNTVVSIFNATGQLTETVSVTAKQGENIISFATASWESGAYYYAVIQNGHIMTSGSITKE